MTPFEAGEQSARRSICKSQAWIGYVDKLSHAMTHGELMKIKSEFFRGFESAKKRSKK
jgi:hypothetical protein